MSKNCWHPRIDGLLYMYIREDLQWVHVHTYMYMYIHFVGTFSVQSEFVGSVSLQDFGVVCSECVLILYLSLLWAYSVIPLDNFPPMLEGRYFSSQDSCSTLRFIPTYT